MKWRFRIPIVIAAASISGCAVGPDFAKPTAPGVSNYTDSDLPPKTAAVDVPGGEAQLFAQDKDLPAQWWKLYCSDALNQLVEQALAANPGLQAAQAALRQAQENVYAEEGAFFPAVNANLQPSRQKFSSAAYGIPGAPSSIFTLYNASVSVSYTLDMFGGIRRQVETLQAVADYQRFQLQAAYVSLTTNVVTAAIQEASLRAQIKETQDILAIEQHQLNVLNSQFTLGGIAKVAVLQQQALLAQEQATLPNLQKQLAQTHNQLAALSGHFPAEHFAEAFDLNALSLPEELPVSLPSKLVEQRPDIRAAEEQLHEASAQVGVATANMLPQLSISGSYGWESVHFHNVISPGDAVWSIGADLLQPIFHGGQLYHQRKASLAAYDQANAQYKNTVLSAFQNVADTLRALQYDADALVAQVNASRAAASSLDISRMQFQTGAITYLSLLDSERTYQQARLTLVQAQAARYADTAALFQALGGGWWNQTDALVPPPVGGRLGGGQAQQTPKPEQVSPLPNPPPKGEGNDRPVQPIPAEPQQGEQKP